jgi:lipopolysaccharide/colanic/teichoic acid biosynthesis glycosyltransferase
MTHLIDGHANPSRAQYVSRDIRRPRWALWIKRIFDGAVSIIALVLSTPLLGAIIVSLLLAQGRPVFYRWQVVGLQGRPFTGYKFRTMVQGADRLRSQLMAQNEMEGPVFKMRTDPRVTPLGRVLRRYSLDELPQLWSVLKGDMSLVGPRPPLQSEYIDFSPLQKRKLLAKPGITCLWQISGRNEISDFEEWVRLDLKYIAEWSLWLDLKILLKTVPLVLSGRGAS